MVEIGGKPILWHIMKMYSAYGINDFIICCGYKGYVIKEYFSNYSCTCPTSRFDMRPTRWRSISKTPEPWRVTLVDTGEKTHDRRPHQARSRHMSTATSRSA